MGVLEETMKITDIKTGDTLLTNSDKFLSRVIVKVMRHWGKKTGRKERKLYSHAGRFAWLGGELYVFGSIASGYNPSTFKGGDFAIMRRRVPLTEEETNKTINYMLHLDSISLGYQYWNFVKWLLRVYLNINILWKKTPRFLYCYEAEYYARQNLDPLTHPDQPVDIFTLLEDPEYEIIHER